MRLPSTFNFHSHTESKLDHFLGDHRMFCRVILLLLVVSGSSLCSASAEPPAEKEKLTIEFRRAETAPAEGLKKADVRDSKQTVYLHPQAEVTLADVQEVVAVEDQRREQLAVSITLTRSGAKKMRTMTEGHLGKPLAIVVNGEVVLAPTIKDRLSSRIMISGLKANEAEELVKLFEKR